MGIDHIFPPRPAAPLSSEVLGPAGVKTSTETADGGSPVQVWPSTVSVGRDPEFDYFMYRAMARDISRNNFLLRTFQRTLKGMTVVDVGTGQLATLALLDLKAGATKVYAVELL